METNEISFENLPKAVAHLLSEVAEIKSLVEKTRPSVPTSKRIPIGIDEACAIIGKAKPTVYALVRKRLIPCYKNGKKLYFFEEELLAWIESGRKRTMLEISKQAKEFKNKTSFFFQHRENALCGSKPHSAYGKIIQDTPLFTMGEKIAMKQVSHSLTQIKFVHYFGMFIENEQTILMNIPKLESPFQFIEIRL